MTFEPFQKCTTCSFQISILPPQSVFGNCQGERGSQKPILLKTFKGKYNAELEFTEGAGEGDGGIKPEKCSVGEYEYFLEQTTIHPVL